MCVLQVTGVILIHWLQVIILLCDNHASMFFEKILTPSQKKHVLKYAVSYILRSCPPLTQSYPDPCYTGCPHTTNSSCCGTWLLGMLGDTIWFLVVSTCVRWGFYPWIHWIRLWVWETFWPTKIWEPIHRLLGIGGMVWERDVYFRLSAGLAEQGHN